MANVKQIKQAMQRGFTLLEVLLVVAIIAILAGIVIIAINPGKNLADSRNAQRSSDVATIIDAVYQYMLDNNGTVPTAIGTTAVEMCKTSVAPATCTSSSLTDLTVVTTGGKYIASLPIDPSCPTNCNANGVGYRIMKDVTTGRITVNAPGAEQGKTIAVTR
jgi:prepilin-type N-terminal cleavage/methylation domain-containing protein